MSGFREQPKGFATKAIHVGQEPEQWSHLSVVPPLVTSTTFKQFSPAEPKVSFNDPFYIFHYLFSFNCSHMNHSIRFDSSITFI